MERGGKFRAKENGYTTVQNRIIRDKALSLQAKGLYLEILSYITAPNFTLYKWFLITLNTNGKRSFETAWQELKKAGYLKQYRIPGENQGKFVYEYELLDTPNLDTPALQNVKKQESITAPVCQTPPPQNVGGGHDHNLHFAYSGQSTICLQHSMENRGDKRNTDLNKTDYNKTHSITPAAQPQFPAMPEQERVSEIDSIEEIEDEIRLLKTLPYTYKSNPQRMEAAIHYMTEWNTFFPAGFNDDLRQRVYNLFNEALIEMCCTDKPMTLKGSYVTYAKVIDKLNQLAKFEDYYVDLSEFSEPAMDNFIRGAEGDEIRNPLAYMKSCIWDAMQTGNVNLYADLRRSGF